MKLVQSHHLSLSKAAYLLLHGFQSERFSAANRCGHIEVKFLEYFLDPTLAVFRSELLRPH